MTLFYNCVWWYAIKKDELLEDNVDEKLVRALRRDYAIAHGLYLAASSSLVERSFQYYACFLVIRLFCLTTGQRKKGKGRYDPMKCRQP